MGALVFSSIPRIGIGRGGRNGLFDVKEMQEGDQAAVQFFVSLVEIELCDVWVSFVLNNRSKT